MELNLNNLVLFGIPSVWLRPLWLIGVGVVITVAVFAGLIALLNWLAPKVGAIARTTAKEATAQPLYYVILALGIFGLIFFPFVPYNTFGEDIKMLKDTSLTLIMILTTILALWTASVSIADEIEGARP